MKRELIDLRIVEEAHYMIDNKATVRQVAKKFGICKSTAHRDITLKLPYINLNLYLACKNILETNLEERAIRGGESTRKYYLGGDKSGN